MADIITEQRIDNPHTTYAQFVADAAAGRRDAGKQMAYVNQTTRLGGFALFYGSAAQNEAAARYLNLIENAQLGGARAVDPGREPVDGGGANPEAIFEIGANARNKLLSIRAQLGRLEAQRLEFVLVMERGPTAYAKWRYGARQPNSRAVADAKVEVRRIVDRLAAILDLETAIFRAQQVRASGDVPTTYVGDISTRRVA